MQAFSVLLLAMLGSFGIAMPVVTPGGGKNKSYDNENLLSPYFSTLMEDKNQNWGYDDSDETEENYGVNPRPLNFDKIPRPDGKTYPSS
ncbi:hypothetical protein BM221_007257 [Beauveria bassiana]|uniref:Uncharacterized protein n=1 Tax=Beauveria bassiana TaxID=176275 RepID=A0A2N6NK22_BEABA|nr:hypothetical protein BM221_007254 [Beauveria bassiana]PMB67587.1 hypothetical protein BM221_007257 [Beauveria bassiana]